MQHHTVLITGAARRLGAATARAMHEAGARVAIHYRGSRDDADALVADLNGRRADSAMAVQADINDVSSLPGLVDAVVERFGGLSGLVNNASSFYPTPLAEVTVDAFDDLVGSNFRAPLFLSQAAAPHLVAAGGFIINMVDIYAARPLADHVVYCAAKAALASVTRSLARELGPAVRVNGIAPGPVMWPESGMTDEVQAEILSRTALKRAGSPTDIARTALFLAESDYVTGQIIAVDGGRSV